MKKFTICSLLLFLFALSLVGCENPSSESTANAPKTTISDSDFEKAIKAKLDSDAQLKAANISVDAQAEKNTATLSGTVSSEALRTKALDLAKSAQPNLVITDKIDVKPSEVSRADYTDDMAKESRSKAKDAGDKLGDSLDDAWIHTKIVAKLIGNSATPERKINVDVVQNIVTLRGNVETAEAKSQAEKVAKSTEGVKSVKNMLTVKKS